MSEVASQKGKMIVIASLLISTLLFSLGSPVLKFLTEQGEAIYLTHPDAISFCNVLFVGNLCAGIISFIFLDKKKFFPELKNTSLKVKGYIGLGCVLAVIYPALMFIALELTSVTQVVLLSRFEGIFYLAFAYFFLKKAVSRAEVFGYAFIGIGILTILLTSDSMLNLKASSYILIAAVVFGISEILSTKILAEVSQNTFMFIRNFASAIIFFWIAVYLFGFDHFGMAFYGDLWITMAVYSLVIIVLGQSLWYRSLSKAKSSWPSDFALMIPFYSIIFAWLLLGEIPDFVQSMAIGVIVIGILITKFFGKVLDGKKQPLSIDAGLIGK